MDDGTRAVQEGILNPFPNADLDILVIWIAMMSGDTHKTAQKAVEKFKDRRVRQFYDPEKVAGKVFSKSLGHEGEVVWDFYLFYPARSEWKDLPPVPEIFMHQLRDSWADQDRLFEKDMLKAELTRVMQLLFP